MRPPTRSRPSARCSPCRRRSTRSRAGRWASAWRARSASRRCAGPSTRGASCARTACARRGTTSPPRTCGGCRITAQRVLAASAGWFRNHGVDEASLGRTREALARLLQGGRHLTRDELRELLTAEGLDVSGQRLIVALFDAELRCVVCSGPLAGSHHTYALVDERVPPTPRLEPEEATARLVARYLAGHGPATLKDLRWWSNLTLKQLRAAVEDLGDAVAREVVGGVEYLRLASEPAPGVDGLVRVAEAPRFQLLQVFDELFVGYSETRGLLDPDGEYGAVLSIAWGELTHVVVEGDRIAGRWRHDRRGKAVEVTVELARPLSRDDREALAEAAERYGSFIGAEVRLTLRG